MSSTEPLEPEQPFLKYSDDPTVNEPHHEIHRVPNRTKFLPPVLVFITTSLLWILVIFFIVPPRTMHFNSLSKPGDYRTHNLTSNARLITCGNSSVEAKARGCKYDILLNFWVPAQCMDQESIEEYADDGSWGAYRDKNMTQKLSIEEMGEVDHYYTSIRDHVNHCAVMWRRQFWVFFEERKAFDTMVASPAHTEHCSQYLMDVTDMKWAEPTTVGVGFGGCWIRE